MNPILLNAAIAPAAFFVLALPALRKRENRVWFLALVTASLIDQSATLMPIADPALALIKGHWNWSGKIFSLGALLVIAIALMVSGTFKARDFGLTFSQARGTGQSILFVMIPFLVVIAVLTATMFGSRTPPSPETVYYQSTMPGLAEELSFRGILLGLQDQMFAGRIRLGGAAIGYGAIATSFVFGLVHGIQFDSHMALHVSLGGAAVAGFTGFLLAWLRSQTGSLVLPVIAHNATNVILESVPLLA
ncbi:MAG: CPBP family glutamic-type intramembrane protease [Rhizomicrobium sp.]|jgi:membrane protease YdiL (CAAX protease family)